MRLLSVVALAALAVLAATPPAGAAVNVVATTEDLADLGTIQSEVAKMAGSAARWLDKRDTLARTVTLKMRYADFRTITRSHSTEATRDATATRVQRQAVELPQLEACLVEVRRSLDRAFHATNNPRITVPPLSDTCRVLSSAAGGG